MNYLAHAYLSFEHEEILVGNMISDFVKGKTQYTYSPAIQKGITLHRLIDRFTDDHPATKEANRFFKPSVRLYAGAFTDVVYDHFLAAEPLYWQEIPLPEFSSWTYGILTKHHDVLPPRFQQMLPYMKMQDWLYNYRHREGTGKSFEGIVRRAVYLNNSVAAFEAFEKHYKDLHQLSQSFLPDVKKFASITFSRLMKD